MIQKMAEFKISSPPNFASSHRNTIVLNGSNNFSSLRIEDPKKATNLLNPDNDVCLRTMINKVPQINQYFTITDKLGEGTFSKVYKAKLKRQNNENINSKDGELSDEFALKYIIPIVKPVRVAKELRFLRDLGGLSNVISMKACFYHAGHTVIVMPIIEHDKFMDYLQKMCISEVRDYMRNLLISLERVHAHGIIHRDIKPSNFLYNRSSRRYALVDFGLSQSERDLYHAMNNATFQATNKASQSITRLNQSESKARKNLNFKFVANNIAPSVNSNHINNGNNNNDGSKLIIKMKRSFNEIENKTNYVIVNNNVENAPQQTALIQTITETNKNKRAKFFEDSTTSSVFISPITPGNQVLVPSTPVKVRTPLGETDTNQLQSTSLTPYIQSLVFETPTKTANSEVQNDVHKTPIKSTLLLPEIPETPPKTIQKKFMFKANNNIKKHLSQSASVVSNSIQLPNYHRKENIQKYSTPKLTKPNASRFNSKKILHPELSNVAAGRDPKTVSSSTNLFENSSCRTVPSPCDCVENASICYGCLTKPELNVPRAGTPGFRAPEILLRCQNQSTKIDIWSTGVIFASLLSGRYPFFRSVDDMTCLAEIITLIGSSKMKRAAAALGKTLVISQRRPTVDFKEICCKLRDSLQQSCKTPDIVKDFRAPDSAYDLLTHLLDPNPFTRYSANEALSHPFFMTPLSPDSI